MLNLNMLNAEFFSTLTMCWGLIALGAYAVWPFIKNLEALEDEWLREKLDE